MTSPNECHTTPASLLECDPPQKVQSSWIPQHIPLVTPCKAWQWGETQHLFYKQQNNKTWARHMPNILPFLKHGFHCLCTLLISRMSRIPKVHVHDDDEERYPNTPTADGRTFDELQQHIVHVGSKQYTDNVLLLRWNHTHNTSSTLYTTTWRWTPWHVDNNDIYNQQKAALPTKQWMKNLSPQW